MRVRRVYSLLISVSNGRAYYIVGPVVFISEDGTRGIASSENSPNEAGYRVGEWRRSESFYYDNTKSDITHSINILRYCSRSDCVKQTAMR